MSSLYVLPPPPTLSQTPASALLTLPAELLPLIRSHLLYPDILCLRLTHPRFYYSPLLSTNNDAGIRLRVAWLCERAQNHALRNLAHSSRPFSGRQLASYIPSLLITSYSSTLHTRSGGGSEAEKKWGFYLRALGISRVTIPGLLDWNVSSSGAWSGTAVRLKTDAEFLANPEVQRLLRARWRHEGCMADEEGGCEVLRGQKCVGPKRKRVGGMNDIFEKGSVRTLVREVWTWEAVLAMLIGIVVSGLHRWILQLGRLRP